IFPALCWPSLLHSIFYLAYSVPSKLYLKTGLKLPSWYGVQIKIIVNPKTKPNLAGFYTI
ncbi:MAG: hypothetical protein WA631_09390, partial [Nitrososphaeraceae archaeon]